RKENFYVRSNAKLIERKRRLSNDSKRTYELTNKCNRGASNSLLIDLKSFAHLAAVVVERGYLASWITMYGDPRLSWISLDNGVSLKSFDTKMRFDLVLTLFILVWGFVECRWAHDYPAIQDCQVTSVPGSDLVALLCRLRTINSEIDTTNFSVIPPLDTAKLKIECSDVLFFQSALQKKSFYHLKNLENLDIQYCKIGEVPKEAFLGLSKLRNLTLKTYNTDWSAMALKLAPDAFRDQRRLEKLDLGDNNIWTLPPKLFCGLGNLTFLNMSRNKLQNVENLSFGNSVGKCAPSLRFLDLSYNNFHHLPESSFEALKNLTILNISMNGIREIADQVFFGMYSLELLDISGNLLTTLPPELFKENKRLAKFYARNNSLTVLAPGLFTGLGMLLELDLSDNELTNTWVNSETFMDLIRLATLDLSHNKISRLDMATYRDLTNLQVLNLQHNMIQYIAPDTFSGLFRLHTLLLSHNMMTIISKDTFKGLIALTDLRIDNNNLAEIDSESLTNSTRLKSLHLKNNSLKEIPLVISFLPNLSHLDVSINNVKAIYPNTFAGLNKLSTLYLESNEIEEINKNTFYSLISLQVINCASNNIRTIQNGAFDNNRELKAVRVDDNSLTNVHGLFSNLSNLRWLNLSKNHLEMFDYAFIPRELEYLDLRHNSLNELGNHFEIESQLHLKVLDASYNKLRVISASSVPDSIEIIFLNNNLISTVQPYTFFKKKNLSRVDLFSNKIRNMDQNALRLSILSPNKPVPEFYLAENPFECDCTFEWLQTVNIQEEPHQTPRVVDLTSIMCHLLSRRGQKLVPLLEAQKLQFLCEYDSHCFSLCHCCDFDACDCEMTCPRNCTCFHDDSWTANIVDCSNSGLQTIPDRIPMDASEVYLDGNEIPALSSHTFIGRKNLRVLFINGSHVNEIYNRTFNGLRKLKILYLNNNNISTLKGFEFEHLGLLKELYLHSNSLISLKILRIDDNMLSTLSVSQFNENLLLKNLWIGNNNWTCDCAFIEEMKKWIEDSPNLIVDKPDFFCTLNENGSQRIHLPSYNESCGIKNLTTSYEYMTSHNYLFFPTISLGVCAFLLTVILIIFCNRNRMRIWMFAKYGVRIFQKSDSEGDGDKLFDAYISYSSKDEVFAEQILAPELERGCRSYKLYLHYRDSPVSPIPGETIITSVDSSRRTILVLSDNFIKSEWSRYEFRSAHHEILRNRRKKVLVIIVGDVLQRDLDPDLRLYLKTNTILKWGDTRFWMKINDKKMMIVIIFIKKYVAEYFQHKLSSHI
ncbi:Toll-like receptor Tollo, partial [Armadillidium nasatum]